MWLLAGQKESNHSTIACFQIVFLTDTYGNLLYQMGLPLEKI